MMVGLASSSSEVEERRMIGGIAGLVAVGRELGATRFSLGPSDYVCADMKTGLPFKTMAQATYCSVSSGRLCVRPPTTISNSRRLHAASKYKEARVVERKNNKPLFSRDAGLKRRLGM